MDSIKGIGSSNNYSSQLQGAQGAGQSQDTQQTQQTDATSQVDSTSQTDTSNQSQSVSQTNETDNTQLSDEASESQGAQEQPGQGGSQLNLDALTGNDQQGGGEAQQVAGVGGAEDKNI